MRYTRSIEKKKGHKIMIILKLGHWNGNGFRVYNRFTKKTVGYLIDEIDWQFVDEQGIKYKLPVDKKFSLDQAINYFTSKNFIKALN